MPSAAVAQASIPAPIGPVDSAASIGEEPPRLPLPDNPTAVLLVDAARAPSALKALANVLPEDQLAARLGEARLLSSGRTVIALIAFTEDGRTVEAALVENASVQPVPDPRSEAVTGVTAFMEHLSAIIDASEPAFELIELSDQR